MKRKVLLATASFAALSLWDGVAAQTDGGLETLSEIVVTARRRDERLVDVPAAVSVIDAAALADRGGAQDARELLLDQPSVRFNNLNSTVTSEISMRASSTARATNGDPAVGLYRDGAYIGGGAIGGRNFSRIDMLDIGRVEVLRGTQGALYGRNAVGGAINIVSAAPEFDNSGHVRLRYDFETEGEQAQAVANVALSDEVAIRISGDYVRQDEGFFYNPNNDIYFDRQKGHGLRGQLRLVSGPLDLTILAETQDLVTPAIHYQIAIAPGSPGFPGGFVQPKYSYSWNTEPRASQNVDTYQLRGTLDLGDGLTLSSTSHFRIRTSAYDLDTDGVDAASFAAARATGAVTAIIDTGASSSVLDETQSFNQDIHIGGTGLADRLDWLAGVETVILDSRYQITARRTPTTLNPSPGTFAPAHLKYRSYAGYGSVAYDLTELVNVTGEVRFTKDDRALTARLYDLRTGTAVGGTARMVDARTKPDNVSYNATLAYRLDEGMLAYAKLGSSYRAGGFNSNLGDLRQPVPIPAAYGDEDSKSYEIGVRGEPTRGLYLAVAGYYNDLQNMIAQTDNGCALTNSTCPVAATTFLTNVGDAESYGAEAELTKLLSLADNRLRITLAASWQDGKVKTGRFAGINLPQVPEFLGSANVNLSRPFIADSTLFANIFYSTQIGGFQELRANSVDLDDFDPVNVRLGITKGAVSIAVGVDNLGNDVYRVARDTTVNRYSTPRVYRLEVTARF